MQTETAFTGKQKKYLQQKQKYEALEEQVKDYFVSLQLIPEEHPEEQLAELESHRKDYEKELQEYRRIEQEIRAFEVKEDIPALLALKVPEGEESLESLADEMQVLSERMEECFQTIDSYQKQLSDLQESWDNVENMQEELKALQKKTEEGFKQYELLGMTKICWNRQRVRSLRNIQNLSCRGSGNITEFSRERNAKIIRWMPIPDYR